MERIKLTKREKQIFKILNSKGFEGLSGFNCSAALRTLQDKGFVKAYLVEGGEVIDAYLTSEGIEYITENPKLRNPINWTLVGIIISIILGILSLIFSSFTYIHLVGK